MNRDTRHKFKVMVFLVFIAIFLSIAAGVMGEVVVYHGNSKSYVFHKPGCRYYNCKKCTVEFNTRDEAIAAGYKPCKVCKP